MGMTHTIPTTRPNWTTGKYSVFLDAEVQGYFRQFRSAWAWREYLRRVHPQARILIYEDGVLVNVSNPIEKDLLTGI